MSLGARRGMARALVVAASLVLVLALIAGYVRRAAVDSDQFANRATAALHNDSVRTLIAEEITDQVVLKQESDLIAARPLIESVGLPIVGSRAFTSLFRAAVRDVHRAVFDRSANTVTLTIRDLGTVLAAALQRFRPALARKVEAAGRVQLTQARRGERQRRPRARRRQGPPPGALLPLLALLLVGRRAGGLARPPADRRRARGRRGAAGSPVVMLRRIARSVAIGHVQGPEARAAAGAVWDAFLGDLRSAAWILAARRGRRRRRGVADPADGRRRAPAPRRRLGRHRAAGDRARRVAARRRASSRPGWPGSSRATRSSSSRSRSLGVLLIYTGRERAPAGDLSPAPPAGGARRPASGSRRRAPAAGRGAGPRHGADRRRRGRLRRLGRHHDRRARRDGPLQRPRGALRPPARPRRARRHPQLDVGPAAGLVLGRAGPPDRRRSSRTASGACSSTPTTPTGRQRQAAHVLRQPEAQLRRQADAGRRRAPTPSTPRNASATVSASRRGHARACTCATRSASSAPPRWARCSTTSTTSSWPTRTRSWSIINQDYVTPAGLRRRR